ncbi:MAG TPA: peptidoglycan DD-metalloendopeptidase family protein [Actinomycetota bacterium]|nr:peptidoglycan DD-metalloendopeptidase family protein [Actinomycetota bacterium]
MADSSRDTTRGVVGRVLIAVLAAVLLASLSATAGAQTEEKLEAAEAEFERLVDQIEAQQGVLQTLQLEAAEIAQRLTEAQGRYEQITEELRNTRLQLQQARWDFESLRGELEERARQTFIVGPGSDLEFLLGATSIVDLSARVEFMNALNETDSDLATEVQNLRNALTAKKEAQEKLQAKAADALRAVEIEQAALDAKLAEQQSVLDDLEVKKARAAELVEDLEKKYKRELAALSQVKFYADGVFKVCPVDPPRAAYDGFGAPRYGGGYHPHAGNDIMAPQGTAIRATFDGYARISTSSLGGYAVYVHGEHGYTYNAHLMAPGVTGPVQAGQIIGYVGTTGNASTPHNHFEWHPNVIPSNWPVSPYGYSMLGNGAVNPWPLLSQVC